MAKRALFDTREMPLTHQAWRQAMRAQARVMMINALILLI